jgi:NitT/TauT family transport system substrate-binding protein
MKNRVKCLTGCLLLVASLASLAACGTSTPNAAQEKIKVRMQLKWVPQAQFMGFYVAAEKGYYADEGLDVELLPGGPDIIADAQVSSGAAEFGMASFNSLISYQAQGYPLVSLAQL